MPYLWALNILCINELNLCWKLQSIINLYSLPDHVLLCTSSGKAGCYLKPLNETNSLNSCPLLLTIPSSKAPISPCFERFPILALGHHVLWCDNSYLCCFSDSSALNKAFLFLSLYLLWVWKHQLFIIMHSINF